MRVMEAMMRRIMREEIGGLRNSVAGIHKEIRDIKGSDEGYRGGGGFREEDEGSE